MTAVRIAFLLILHLTAGIAMAQAPNLQNAAAEWLFLTRSGEPADSVRIILSKASPAALNTELRTDEQKKAFWINVYNAATQTALKAEPHRYANRSAFFKAKQVIIAGEKLSLDDIEHGILRRSKNKLSLGYLPKLLPGRFEREFRVDKLDYRIHFALNCGARSCPPVSFYKAEHINEQLQSAMNGHLSVETDYDSTRNVAAVTAFMGWFRADFGGKKGIRRLLISAAVLPAGSTAGIRFKKYDWNLYLDNFKE